MERLLSALGFTGIAAVGLVTVLALYILDKVFSIFKSFASLLWTVATTALIVGAVALIWPIKNAVSLFNGDDESLDNLSKSEPAHPKSEAYRASSNPTVKVFDGEPLKISPNASNLRLR